MRYFTVSHCIPHANWMLLGITITHFACMTHWFASSNNPTTVASTASCKARRVVAWKHKLPLCSCVISLTHHTKGKFLIRKPMVFWNLLISLSATVPGLKLFFFFFSVGAWLALGPSSSLFLFSGTFHLLPIFMSPMWFFASLYSITLAIMIFFHCTICFLQFKLNTHKTFHHGIWSYDINMTLHCNDILISCQHIISLLILSVTSLFSRRKKNWTCPPWRLQFQQFLSILTDLTCLYPRKKSHPSARFPCFGNGLTTYLGLNLRRTNISHPPLNQQECWWRPLILKKSWSKRILNSKKIWWQR